MALKLLVLCMGIDFAVVVALLLLIVVVVVVEVATGKETSLKFRQ